MPIWGTSCAAKASAAQLSRTLEAAPVLVEGAEVKASNFACSGLNAHAVEGGRCGDDCRTCLQDVPLGHVQQV